MTDPTIFRTLGRAVSRESAGLDSTVGVPDDGTGCVGASSAGAAACAPFREAGCSSGVLRPVLHADSRPPRGGPGTRAGDRRALPWSVTWAPALTRREEADRHR